MKTNKSKTKTKKAVKTPKAEIKSSKKPKKAASVKTKKEEKKVSKVKKPSAKPKKTTKTVTLKKKTVAKLKTSAAKTKKVPLKKKPVKTTKVAKKPEKTVAKKATVKTKAVTAKKPVSKPAVKKKPGKTEAVSKAKVKSKAKTIAKKKEPSKIKPLKQIAIPATKMSFRQAAIKKQQKERSKKTTKTELKIFLPAKDQDEEIMQGVPSPGLRDEYGENDFFIMPIDPKYIFVNWEITKEAFIKARGTLNIRAYDITGITFDGSIFNKFFDISINNRSGSGFFEINMQGCDVVMEIGVLQHDGSFKPIIRSNRVSIPSLMTFDELGIVLKLYAAGVPVGY